MSRECDSSLQQVIVVMSMMLQYWQHSFLNIYHDRGDGEVEQGGYSTGCLLPSSWKYFTWLFTLMSLDVFIGKWVEENMRNDTERRERKKKEDTRGEQERRVKIRKRNKRVTLKSCDKWPLMIECWLSSISFVFLQQILIVINEFWLSSTCVNCHQQVLISFMSVDCHQRLLTTNVDYW